MTLFCLFLFVIVCFQYLSQHLAINNSKIPWINWFLTFFFFPHPTGSMESLQNSTGSRRQLFGLGQWKIEPVNTHQMSSYMFAGIINSKKNIWVELLASLVIKWWYLTIFNIQNNGSSIWWCETFILALRRVDKASRHQPSNQPCYRPGEVRKCTD